MKIFYVITLLFVQEAFTSVSFNLAPAIEVSSDDCEEGTYLDVQTQECQPCSDCGADFLYIRKECTRESNTQCGWCGSKTVIRNNDFRKKCQADNFSFFKKFEEQIAQWNEEKQNDHKLSNENEESDEDSYSDSDSAYESASESESQQSSEEISPLEESREKVHVIQIVRADAVEVEQKEEFEWVRVGYEAEQEDGRIYDFSDPENPRLFTPKAKRIIQGFAVIMVILAAMLYFVHLMEEYKNRRAGYAQDTRLLTQEQIDMIDRCAAQVGKGPQPVEGKHCYENHLYMI